MRFSKEDLGNDKAKEYYELIKEKLVAISRNNVWLDTSVVEQYSSDPLRVSGLLYYKCLHDTCMGHVYRNVHVAQTGDRRTKLATDYDLSEVVKDLLMITQVAASIPRILEYVPEYTVETSQIEELQAKVEGKAELLAVDGKVTNRTLYEVGVAIGSLLNCFGSGLVTPINRKNPIPCVVIVQRLRDATLNFSIELIERMVQVGSSEIKDIPTCLEAMWKLISQQDLGLLPFSNPSLLYDAVKYADTQCNSEEVLEQSEDIIRKLVTVVEPYKVLAGVVIEPMAVRSSLDKVKLSYSYTFETNPFSTSLMELCPELYAYWRNTLRDKKPSFVKLTEEERKESVKNAAAKRTEAFSEKALAREQMAGNPIELTEEDHKLLGEIESRVNPVFFQSMQGYLSGLTYGEMRYKNVDTLLSKLEVLHSWLYGDNEHTLYQNLLKEGKLVQEGKLTFNQRFDSVCQRGRGFLDVAQLVIPMLVKTEKEYLKALLQYINSINKGAQDVGQLRTQLPDLEARASMAKSWYSQLLGSMRVIDMALANDLIRQQVYTQDLDFAKYAVAQAAVYSESWNKQESLGDLLGILQGVTDKNIVKIFNYIFSNYPIDTRIESLLGCVTLPETIGPLFIFSDRYLGKSIILEYYNALESAMLVIASQLTPGDVSRCTGTAEALKKFMDLQVMVKGMMFPSGTKSMRGVRDYDRVALGRMYHDETPEAMALLSKYVVFWG